MKRLTRQVISQWTATALVGAITLALQIVLARAFGPSVFGLYGVVTAVSGIAVILQDGGFRSLLYREATHPTSGMPQHSLLFSYAVGWNLLATAILLLLTGVASTENPVLCIAVAIVILTNLGRVAAVNISALMRAGDHFAVEARWQVENRVVTALSMIAVALATSDLIKVLIVGAIAQAVLFALPTAQARLTKPRLGCPKIVMRTCAILAAVDVVTALYFRSDVLILAAFGRPAEEIGIYVALMRLVEAYVFISAPITAIFFRSARLIADNTKLQARRIWMLTGLFAIPVMAVLALSVSYQDLLIELVYGSGYSSGGVYLPWLVAACFAIVPNGLLGQALFARNREVHFLAATVGALMVNFVLNFMLVPARGALGAAQATVATEYALLVLLMVAFHARSKNPSVVLPGT